jgi:hypothetical protein
MKPTFVAPFCENAYSRVGVAVPPAVMVVLVPVVQAAKPRVFATVVVTETVPVPVAAAEVPVATFTGVFWSTPV